MKLGSLLASKEGPWLESHVGHQVKQVVKKTWLAYQVMKKNCGLIGTRAKDLLLTQHTLPSYQTIW